jgi:hypothetical protein
MNGTCSIIGGSPTGEFEAWNRHQERLRWKQAPAVADVFRETIQKHSPGGWAVFVAEFLHAKVSGGPRDTFYIHDVLVANGSFLYGTSYGDRLSLLTEWFPAGRPRFDGDQGVEEYSRVTSNVWRVRTLEDPGEYFGRIQAGGIVEGVVLKNPAARLECCDRESANSMWAVKCRRATKNYAL